MNPKSQTFPASFTPEKQKEMFEEMLHLYDLADSALQVVLRKDVQHRDKQLELLTPVVTQVTNSANILTAYFNEVVNNGLPITREVQDTMENAFRNIFYTVKECVDKADKGLPKNTEILETVSLRDDPQKKMDAAAPMATAFINKLKSKQMPDSKGKSSSGRYHERFRRDIKPGVTQLQASALQNSLPENGGGDLIQKTLLMSDQAAQLARELAESKVDFIRSFDHAVPTFAPSSKRARQLSGIGGNHLVHPGLVADVQKLN